MTIVALYDMTGYSVRDWAEAGEQCYCFDSFNEGRVEKFPSGGSIEYRFWNAFDPQAKAQVLALSPTFIIGFPPCTDLAVSGAAHFAKKREENPNYLNESLFMVWMVARCGRDAKCPWLIENPVGVLSSIWRKPDYSFEPFNFGGYLPKDDSHPRWAEYIEARDAYSKTTHVWASKELIWPKHKNVPYKSVRDESGGQWSTQAAKLGGKSERTKQIRSATPRGFARALFEANYEKVTGKKILDTGESK